MNHYEKLEIERVLSKALCLRSAALTQGGKQQAVNRDEVFEYTVQMDTGECVGLYIVCDGFGGNDVNTASQLAIQAIVAELGQLFAMIESQVSPSLTQPPIDMLHEWVHTAVARANHKVWSYNHHHHLADELLIGTTITLALIYGNLVRIANVGDSRAYVWHAGQLIQVTRDHTWVAELAAAGVISKAEAANHPQRKVIGRALGLGADVETDLFELKLQPGDKLLLCSDGLWNSFPDTAELSQWLRVVTDPDQLCWQLVAEASYRDDFDDISVVVAQADEKLKQHEVDAAQVENPMFEEAAELASAALVN